MVLEARSELYIEACFILKTGCNRVIGLAIRFLPRFDRESFWVEHTGRAIREAIDKQSDGGSDPVGGSRV